MVQHSSDRAFPGRRHRQAVILERAALAGAVKGDDPVPALCAGEQQREDLLGVFIEAARYDDGSARRLGGVDIVGRKGGLAVGHFNWMQLVELAHAVQEPGPGRTAPRVARVMKNSAARS